MPRKSVFPVAATKHTEYCGANVVQGPQTIASIGIWQLSNWLLFFRHASCRSKRGMDVCAEVPENCRSKAVWSTTELVRRLPKPPHEVIDTKAQWRP